MGDITKDFSLSEFSRSEKAKKYGFENTIPEQVRPHIRGLVLNVLQPLRDSWGPMTISSGYRCKLLNDLVGGVATSQHCKGEAADIATDDPAGLAALARDLDLPFDQMILYPTFVHFSHRLGGPQRGQILYNKSYQGPKLWEIA